MSQAIRERLTRAKEQLERYADEQDAKSGGPDSNYQTELITRFEEIKNLSKQLELSGQTSSLLGDVSKQLAELGEHPLVKSPEDIGLVSANYYAGPNNTPRGVPVGPTFGGKTLGEMWTESPNFKALEGISHAGIIPESQSVKTVPFMVDAKALITGGSATSAGAAVFNDARAGITDLVGYRKLTVADLVTRGSTTSDAIDYVTVTARTSNAGMFAETTHVTSSATKPESSMTLAVNTVNVRTIAHWIPITRRAAADAPQVRTLVDAFLRAGLEEKLEDQILNGAGTGEEFQGILGVTGIQTQDATVGGGGNVFDSIALALSKVQYTAFREPTGIVMNPLDWFSTDLLLKKEGTSLNSYVYGNPGASLDQQQNLWGYPVVITPVIAQNTALVGDFRQAVLYEREGITMYMTDSHADYFIRNVLVILAEMRAALAILDPRAFVKVSNV